MDSSESRPLAARAAEAAIKAALELTNAPSIRGVGVGVFSLAMTATPYRKRREKEGVSCDSPPLSLFLP